jgi:DNA-binding IclR family transcriptional regulator
VLLSSLPEPERRRYVWEDNFPALTSNTITAPEALERELERVERQGYAMDDCEIFDNLRCVAVPIHDWDGRVIASLSTSAPADVMKTSDIPEVASQLAEHAAIIGSKLYPQQRPGLVEHPQFN